MKRSYTLYLVASLVVLSLVFSWIGRQFLFYLLFGWIAYLARVLPRVEIRWDGTIFFLACLLLLGFLFHVVARWLRREMSVQESQWDWRSTAMVLGIVIVLFVAGTAMVGVVHQGLWLVSDDRALTVRILPGGKLRSQDNLKEMGFALMTGQEVSAIGRPSKGGRPAKHSWFTDALMFANYVTEMDRKVPWDHPDNREVTQKLVPILLNPGVSPIVLRDGEGYAVGHYAGNSNVFDENEQPKSKDFGGGKSKMILIGEVNANFQPWAKPGVNRDPDLGINRSPNGFGGLASSGGAHFFMADGSVKFLSSDTDPDVLRAMSAPEE